MESPNHLNTRQLNEISFHKLPQPIPVINLDGVLSYGQNIYLFFVDDATGELISYTICINTKTHQYIKKRLRDGPSWVHTYCGAIQNDEFFFVKGFKFNFSNFTWSRLPIQRPTQMLKTSYTIFIDKDVLCLIKPYSNKLRFYILDLKINKWTEKNINTTNTISGIDYACVMNKKIYIFGPDVNANENILYVYDNDSITQLDCGNVPYLHCSVHCAHTDHLMIVCPTKVKSDEWYCFNASTQVWETLKIPVKLKLSWVAISDRRIIAIECNENNNVEQYACINLGKLFSLQLIYPMLTKQIFTDITFKLNEQ